MVWVLNDMWAILRRGTGETKSNKQEHLPFVRMVVVFDKLEISLVGLSCRVDK